MNARRDTHDREAYGCEDAARLDAFRAGELSGRERRAVESHLDDCEECRRALADLETGETFADLLREARADVPDTLRRRLIETTTTALGRENS